MGYWSPIYTHTFSKRGSGWGTRWAGLNKNYDDGVTSHLIYIFTTNDGDVYHYTGVTKAAHSNMRARVRINLSSGWQEKIMTKPSTSPSDNQWFSDGYVARRDVEIYLEEYVTTPAQTPTSITYPNIVKGGDTITISWGTSTNATRYHLERSIDGGSYSQIYQGTARTRSDTIPKGTSTVQYRVRGYSTDGYSAYRTGSIVTVKNFPEMGIRVGGALKTSDAGWVRVNGQLREIDTMWVRINGALKEVQ